MKRSIVWFLHAGYWSVFLLLLLTFFFFAVFVPAHSRVTIVPVAGLAAWGRLMLGFAVLPGAITFYACYGYLFDYLLSKQRFIPFIAASLLTAFIASCTGAALASQPFLFGPAFLFGDEYNSALFVLLLMSGLAWINGMLAAVIKGSLTWYREIRLKEELHRRNMETELALVRSQIDPHFLFNTLNSIDILITRDAEAASTYLNKLSGIMRFLLYETKARRIALERELDYVQQYIDLQKIRTSNLDYVDMAISGQFCGQVIAPMILLPFIENAFKHTESRKAESKIHIHLHLEKRQLVFSCTNTLFTKEAASENGLGNPLIRKRLDLLYPNSHMLTTTSEAQLYRVQLKLYL